MADDEMKRLLDGLLTTETGEPDKQTIPVTRRWNRRAIQLQTAAEVAAAATSILELDRLLPLVVDLIRDRFGLYYVGIFLLEEQPSPEGERYATLVAATGRAGQRMMEAGYKMRVGGDSMVGWCMARGRARIALDVGKDAVRFDNPYLPDTRSEMALPLLSRGQVIGAMTIQSTLPAAFTEDDIIALQTMADQLANAIQNARLFEERERRITELSIINEIGRAMSATLTMDALLEVVHLQVSRLFDTTNFYIALYEEGSEYWRSAFHIERGEQQPLARYSIKSGLTGYIIRHRRPLLFRSSQEVTAFLEEQGIPLLGEMARSWLGVPLLVANKLVGVMAIQSYEQDHLYDEQDLALFSTIAAQVATALENARLFQERERQIVELEILDQIRQAISQQLELDQVLETVYEQVRRIMPADAFFLALYDARTDLVTYPLVYDQGRRYEMPSVPLAPTGHLARVLKTKEPVLLNRTAEELATFELRPEQAIGDVEKPSASLLFVPLSTGRQITGVMSAQSYRLNAYDERHVALLQAIADQTAIAIERASLFEEVRSRAEELAVLNEIGQTISSVLDLDALLHRIVDTIKERFGHYFVGILLLEGDELVFRSGSIVGDSGVRWERGDLRLALDGYGLNVAAATSGRPVLVNDVSRDERYGTVEGLEPVKAELDVPITVKGRVIGTLTVQSDHVHAFSQNDVAVMQALASQAGVAIENARLFEQAQRRAKEQATLRKITEIISTARDMQSLLDEALDQTLEALGLDAGLVALYSQEKRGLVLVTHRGLPQALSRSLQEQGFEGTLCAYVYQTGETVSLHDLREGSPVNMEKAIELGLLAYLGTPIGVKGQRWGIMCFFHRSPRSIHTAEIALLRAIGDQVGLGIENVRLLEETQAALAESEALYQATRAISEPLGLEPLTESLVEAACRLTNARHGAVLTLDPESGKPMHFKTYGVDLEKFPIRRLPKGEGLLGLVLAGRTIRIDDLQGHPGATAAPDWHFPIRTVLGVPLFYGGEVRGLVMVGSPKDREVFTQRDERVLTSLATQAAIAIESRRLLEQAQNRARQERTLREIATRVRAATDTETVMRAAVRELGRVLNRPTFIRLGDERQLIHPATTPGDNGNGANRGGA